MKKRIWFYKMAVLCLALFHGSALLCTAAEKAAASTPKGTNAVEENDKKENTSLKEAEKEKKNLEKELAEAKQALKDLKETKGNVEGKLAELNSRLISISGRITALEEQLEQKNREISKNQERLAEAKRMREQQYEDMKQRIRFTYENSHTSYMSILLESKDITALLNSVEYISEIQNYDRRKLQEYTEMVEYITGVEEQLEQDCVELQEMKASVAEEKEAVAALMKQKETELADIAGEITNAQSEADYYAAEIQAQEELIAEIKRIEAEKAAAGKEKHPYTGGVFTWPCPSSTRLTSDYGVRTSPTSGASTNHKGIDIGAAGGADIVAAAAGTVTSAAYSSAAGNYIMIDHGGGVYTVYMHASELLAVPGQEVAAGQVIAKVGSTGISTGNHLHFGVSVDGSYVSPWGYLGG